jgi:CarD family transcriptional regulator
MFAVGEVVVYPGHGVCKIEKIVERLMSGVNKRFFLLRALGAEMCILIPEDKIEHAGLRHVVDVQTAERILAILKEPDVVKVENNHNKQSWNRRFREYMVRIKTGNTVQIAEVLRTLSSVGLTKCLSFGEKRILNTSKALLAQEIAVAKRCSTDRALNEIEAALNGEQSI